MRVAVCFWGLCRSTDRVLESIETCIFTPLREAGIVYDTFLHTYKLFRPYTNMRASEIKVQLKNTNWKLLNPIDAVVENQDAVDKVLQLSKYRHHGDPWIDDERGFGTSYTTLDNHIRALWSLKQVTCLWSNTGRPYDAVLYCRPDVRYLTALLPSWIENIQRGVVLIPDFHLYHGSNDRFAIGHPRDMLVYGMRFDAAFGYSQQKQLHSERFLTDHLAQHGIGLRLVPFRFQRVRADGHVCEADRDL